MSRPALDTSPLVLAEWEALDLERLHGLTLVVGQADSGKSTFCRYLYRHLSQAGQRVAYLDGDPGQSQLGPPTTLSLGFGYSPETGEIQPPAGQFPPEGPYLRSFVGALTPSGHLLAQVIAGQRLVDAARARQAQAILYDTCGLVEPRAGGLSLKLAEIELFRPQVVIAISRSAELEPLLAPLRRSQRAHLIELPAASAARRRSSPTRQANRMRLFSAYFASAHSLWVDWSHLAVFPVLDFKPQRLISFEDVNGFCLGLGIVQAVEPADRQMRVWTPLKSLTGVDAIRLGDVWLDSKTYREIREH